MPHPTRLPSPPVALIAITLCVALAPLAARADDDLPITPVIAVDPTSLDFGVVTQGTCAELDFDILNIGDPGSVLNVTHFTVVGNGTSLVDPPSTPFGVPEGSTEPITVRMCGIGVGLQEGTVTVHSDNAANGSATVAVQVYSNIEPECDAGGPYMGEHGMSVQFDGSGSNDPFGAIVSYDWMFGDGSSGSGVMPTHVYSLGGAYGVTLCVTDDHGVTTCCATQALISGPQMPACDHGGTYVGYAGIPLQFDGSGSYVPGGTIVSYAWEFGDGSTGSGAMPTHVYAISNGYIATLCVTSNAGLENCCATNVNILPGQPPVCDIGGPYGGLSGEPIAFDATGSYDPDGTIVSYLWDFDDGTTASGPTPTHTYSPSHSQSFHVDLCVTDNSGQQSCCSTWVPITVPGGWNAMTTLVLHAVETDFGPCDIPDPCPGATVEVTPGATIAAYLLIRNYDDVAGLQTAFDFGGFEFLNGIWDCRANQVNGRVPAPPGGPTDGTLATAFDCVGGGVSAIIGRLHMVAQSGCLMQVESTYPFGTHVVNCLNDVQGIGPNERGIICAGGSGADVCDIAIPVRETTWGAIKAQYR
ncbi:MAG: PKD domain-containing protein [Candidatus Eiseniibacteriota bacterium]|jgi:PKD repeat protein